MEKLLVQVKNLDSYGAEIMSLDEKAFRLMTGRY
jgi:hypothetical protein